MNLGYIGKNIPSVWAKPLLTDLVNPKQWKTISTKDLLEEGYVVYGANGKIGFYNEFTHETPTLMITCRGATCGNLHISEPYSYINGNAMALDKQSVNLVGVNFLRYVLEARGLEDTISGSAQPQITRQGLSEVRIPLPPLAEQKIIADKLDTLLAQVGTTKARLNRIPNILKRFRQSVLAAAVSGKLTEEWRSEIKTVGEVCTVGFDGPFGSKLKSSDYTESGVRVVRLENLGHLHFYDNKKTYISDQKYTTLIKNTIEIGDILFSSFVDEEVKACVFEEELETYINKADCFCLRPDMNIVVPQYLAYVLASITSYTQIKEQVQGVTRPRINLKILKNLTFKFPSLRQQTEIVRRVEELFAFADSIEQKNNAALERVNNLTQSILAKAFRGELTADWRAANPDLISGENSAEALLAKIQAERDKLALEKKAANKTRKKKA
jgi:type I restriction enzyme S subunit